MSAPPNPEPGIASVNAHATPKGVFVEVRSYGVSVLAAIPVGEVGALVAALQAAAATARAMIGDGPEAGPSIDTAGAVRCCQVGCEEDATHVFTWLGDEKASCLIHATQAERVGSAIGTPVRIIPL